MIQSLNEIKQVSGRDLDGQVDENTLIAGETSAGVFGVFKFLPAVKNAVKNIFVGIAKATVARTTKIAVVKDDGTIEYISADDVLAYKNAKEETITGKKNFTNGIESKSVNTTNLDAESVNASNITASGALKGKTAEVDSLTVMNRDIIDYIKPTWTTNDNLWNNVYIKAGEKKTYTAPSDGTLNVHGINKYDGYTIRIYVNNILFDAIDNYAGSAYSFSFVVPLKQGDEIYLEHNSTDSNKFLLCSCRFVRRK